MKGWKVVKEESSSEDKYLTLQTKGKKEKERKNKDKTNLVTRVADDETFVSDSWTSICLFIFYLSCPFLSSPSFHSLRSFTIAHIFPATPTQACVKGKIR